MFGMKFNLKDRDCIVISSDSETDDVERDEIFKLVVRELPSDDGVVQVEKSEAIDEIVDCYTNIHKKLRKRTQSLNDFDSCKKLCKNNNKVTVTSTDDLEQKMVRNNDICSKLGLRKVVRQTSYFQYEDGKPTYTSQTEEDKAIDYLLNSTSLKRKCKKETTNQGYENDGAKVDEETCKAKKEIPDDGGLPKYSMKYQNLKKVSSGEVDITDICLSCGTIDDVTNEHPLFEGGLCTPHRDMFQEWFFKYDQDGTSSYCSICCMGEQVVICDQICCGKCYCSDCLTLLVASDEYERLLAVSSWSCYFCSNDKSTSLIRRRGDWGGTLQKMFTQHNGSDAYGVPPIPRPISPNERRPIRVLSLFDGIATGLLALKQLGLEIGKFVASEIDENAIRLVQNRHHDVMHIGDITKLSDDDVRRYGPFDLVMGGSPCNDLSGANPRRRGLLDAEGTGCLFFDFYRVLNVARPSPGCSCQTDAERPFFWLFENVLSMKMIERSRISRFLQCDPIMADGRAVSAAARPRLFWGNLPLMRQLNLAPSSDHLTVQSCLEKDRVATVEKLNTITTRPGCLYQGCARVAPVKHRGKDDVLWSTEIERIFGVPEHYTDVNNLGPKERLALLGRSWSVPVMRQLLAPLKEYFASSKTS